MSSSGSRIDSGLLTVLLMVMITSGLVVLTIAGERIEKPVVLLKVSHPSRLYAHASVTTRERMDFAFSLLARREFASLRIQYNTLTQIEPAYSIEAEEAGLAQFAEALEPISILIRETDNDHIPPAIAAIEVEKDDEMFSGIFYDFSLVRRYTDASLSGLVTTSHLVVQNGTEVLHFEGISDLFFNRLGGFENALTPTGDEIQSSISVLRLRRASGVVTYSAGGNTEGSWLDILDSPDFGVVEFQDVERNERISVEYTVETPERPDGWIAQVIRVYGDGELLMSLAYIVE